MTTKTFNDLQNDLFKLAEQITGEKKDCRHRSWAKTVDRVDTTKSNGYAFSGDWVNEGTVEFEIKPTIFLVMFTYGSNKYQTSEYAVVTMNSDGELHPTDIHTNNETGGWALRIRSKVAELLESFNEAGPTAQEAIMATLRERFDHMSDAEIVAAALNVYEIHTR